MLTVTAALLLPALLLAQEVQIGGPAPDLGKERLQAIARARSQLSLKLKVPEAKIALESATPTTWPNASLGCPEPDRMYAQVVTRGWTVILKVREGLHEVRVAGRRAVVCPRRPEKAPIPPSKDPV